MSLTAAEQELGWVEHVCDNHGFLVATTPLAMVTCECGKVARIVRGGRLVDEDLRPTKAKAREVNLAGHEPRHLCGDCGEDFGALTSFARHRAGGKTNKRCRTAHELVGMGWFQDDKGRWHTRGSKSPSNHASQTIFQALEAVLAPVSGEPRETVEKTHPDEKTVCEEAGPNPTRSWARGKPGSRNGETARGPRGERRNGFVYFFQGDTTKRIKIGFSDQPERRLSEVRSGASERMRLLGSLPGTTVDEARYHRQYADSWILNEWFSEDALPDVAVALGVSVDSLNAIPFE